MTRKRPFGKLMTSALVITLCVSCTGNGSSEQPRTVVATTSVLGDIVRNVVGDELEVEVVIGPGVDPHEFAPSGQQAAAIASAGLVVASGLGFEAGLTDVLESAEDDGTEVVWVGDFIDPIPLSDADASSCTVSGDHNAEGAVVTGCDPHFWMDPTRVGVAAETIATALTAAGFEGDWGHRASAYAARLAALDRQVSDLLAGIDPASRRIVTNHDALGYLAAQYDLEVVGVVIPGGSTIGDPSSADLARLVETIKETDARAMFVDGPDSAAVAEALAEELSPAPTVARLFADSLGVAGSGAATIEEMLITDATRIAEALR